MRPGRRVRGGPYGDPRGGAPGTAHLQRAARRLQDDSVGRGGRGCLKGLISVPALLAACADRGVTARDAAELVALAAEGQPDAADVVRIAALVAGRVLAALAAQVDPECIVVYGEPAALDDLVLTPIREQLAALSLPSAPRTIEVRGSTLGAEAAALGGVALLLHTTGQDLAELLDRPVPGAPDSGTAR
ncbi:ROK family protein [Streptomyces brevispora]|uniref:ROK family protein n=1 Tax=Streptomyces brevispora TaxID=887462 RepID=UPI002E3468BE|nr:ROK family protein [Streptomyces brevispora]